MRTCAVSGTSVIGHQSFECHWQWYSKASLWSINAVGDLARDNGARRSESFERRQTNRMDWDWKLVHFDKHFEGIKRTSASLLHILNELSLRHCCWPRERTAYIVKNNSNLGTWNGFFSRLLLHGAGMNGFDELIQSRHPKFPNFSQFSISIWMQTVVQFGEAARKIIESTQLLLAFALYAAFCITELFNTISAVAWVELARRKWKMWDKSARKTGENVRSMRRAQSGLLKCDNETTNASLGWSFHSWFRLCANLVIAAYVLAFFKLIC